MKALLREKGIIRDRPVLIEGDLVANYNRALEQCVHKKTALEAFHIDQRGLSPEIKEELGEDYLQTGPANRYMIVVAPAQREAGLLEEEYSFDRALFSHILGGQMASIETVTRIDALYGLLENNIRRFGSLEDLLLLSDISLTLKTPSGFIGKALAQYEYIKQLRENPELLIMDESAHVENIYRSVKEIGDVTEFDIHFPRVKHKIHSFATRLFGGVFIFRDTHPIPIHRPGEEARLPADEKFLTTVFFDEQNERPEDGPTVRFIPLQDGERVTAFLTAQGLADYSVEKLEQALSRIEDLRLLELGYDVVRMAESQHLEAIDKHQHEMPESWHILLGIKKDLAKGYSISGRMSSAPPAIREILLRPTNLGGRSGGHLLHVVTALLTKLDPHDYQTMLGHNIQDLELLYERTECARTRHYIIQTLTAPTHEQKQYEL